MFICPSHLASCSTDFSVCDYCSDGAAHKYPSTHKHCSIHHYPLPKWRYLCGSSPHHRRHMLRISLIISQEEHSSISLPPLPPRTQDLADSGAHSGRAWLVSTWPEPEVLDQRIVQRLVPLWTQIENQCTTLPELRSKRRFREKVNDTSKTLAGFLARPMLSLNTA